MMRFGYVEVFVLIWIIYIVVHEYAFTGHGGPFVSYMIAILLFVLVVRTIINSASQIKTLYMVITLLGATEGTLCVLQFIGIIPGMSAYFKVTGSWENPNIIAMFLAMTLPAIISLAYDPSRVIKRIAIFAMPLVIAAMSILQCRTALIGTIVIALAMTEGHFHWRKKNCHRAVEQTLDMCVDNVNLFHLIAAEYVVN